MKRNDGKNARLFVRSNRMFRIDDSWFFKTREGDSVGPFEDELEASTQLEVYIRLVNAGLLPVSEELSPGRVAAYSTR